MGSWGCGLGHLRRRRGSWGGAPGVIPAEITGGHWCAAGEAGKKGLTHGPGASERERATLRWGNGAGGWARPVIRSVRARAEGASGLSGVGARGGPGRVARGRPGSGLGRWRARGLRKEGSWASRERAGPQRGVLGRSEDVRGRGCAVRGLRAVEEERAAGERAGLVCLLGRGEREKRSWAGLSGFLFYSISSLLSISKSNKV